MLISIYQRQEDLPLAEAQIERLAREVLSLLELSSDEVIFHFISKEEISQLHKIYFQDPTPTDCITFPIDPERTNKTYSILGEAFICPKVGMEYAPLTPYEEVSLYIIHCILHLAGYEDISDSERDKMRKEETRLLNFAREKNLMLSNCDLTIQKV